MGYRGDACLGVREQPGRRAAPELAQHLGSLRHSPAVDTGAWDKFLAGPDVARCPPELRNELRNAMGAHHLKRYRATRDAKAEVSGSVLVVADPTEPDCPLPNAAREANAVAASFSSALILSGAQATRTRVLDELARHDILHFACHGRADLLNPLDSGLALAGGERLTLDDVLLARLDVRLAVLSACETALPGARLPDEVVGLPTGLVQAGAIGVIGSLWSVPDMVTAELMTRFYAAWRCGGMEPAEALRQAQQSVRDDPNHAWSHPFYWAAFCYHGA